MKKFLCILLCLGIVFFCSCTAKDAEPVQQPEPVQDVDLQPSGHTEVLEPGQEAAFMDCRMARISARVLPSTGPVNTSGGMPP